jgi:hypothetical protein
MVRTGGMHEWEDESPLQLSPGVHEKGDSNTASVFVPRTDTGAPR